MEIQCEVKVAAQAQDYLTMDTDKSLSEGLGQVTTLVK